MIDRAAVVLALEVLFDRTDETALSLNWQQRKAFRVRDSDCESPEAIRKACRQFLAEMICPVARYLEQPELHSPFRPYSADWEC